MDYVDEERFEREYLKVREHRSTCKKWGKEFCLECFGGGLTSFFNKIK
ncbi:hypothetical protein LCGC14_0569920 [marine sediment metagenome]|uniref:Uncharacterized protein n=1 Tax=marine sediment metagenome TaxID=412755 RepID=A0A0F9RJH8_9ZZZZ